MEGITWDSVTGAPDEYLWVCVDDWIAKFYVDGTYIIDYTIPGIGECEGIAFVPPDSLWIADDADDIIYEWKISAEAVNDLIKKKRR